LTPFPNATALLNSAAVPDVFTKSKRSLVMSAIRSKGNKDTELKLASIFRASGIKGWRRHQSVPGRPDFVFRNQRLAVFVDGCFWHGCPKHGRVPGSNAGYWEPKLAGNRCRDRRVSAQLRKAGWTVIRTWEHDLARPRALLRRVSRALAQKHPSLNPNRFAKKNRSKK
jgi:DNA mismatch endonuclease, patch repair protein